MAGSESAVKREAPSATGGGPGGGWTFYYDGDCGFCTRVMRLLAALDRRRRVRWVAFQSLEAYPAGLTRADLQREAYIHHPGHPGAGGEGEVLEGGFYSFRRLARLLPPLWPLWALMSLPGVNKAGEWVYAWVARNRTRFPGSVCSVE